MESFWPKKAWENPRGKRAFPRGIFPRLSRTRSVRFGGFQPPGQKRHATKLSFLKYQREIVCFLCEAFSADAGSRGIIPLAGGRIPPPPVADAGGRRPNEAQSAVDCACAVRSRDNAELWIQGPRRPTGHLSFFKSSIIINAQGPARPLFSFQNEGRDAFAPLPGIRKIWNYFT